MEISARNINTLFEDALWRFKVSAKKTSTRNGEAWVMPEPVLTKVFNPTERVLFYAQRDANPIFHLMESLWILAGRNDLTFVSQFNSRIGAYSDDGRVFNAAYGYRMRQQFGVDQLVMLIAHLTNNPDSRQAVIQLWDANDLVIDTKDRACNTQLIFSIKNGCLYLMVNNRSNDFWWGYAGANAVHFTILQEFVAIALKIPIGTYYTISNNLHLYADLYDASKDMMQPPSSSTYDYYAILGLKPYPLFEEGWASFLHDCDRFCKDPFNDETKYTHKFFKEVAYPMAMVSHVRKNKKGSGYKYAEMIKAEDWKAAVFEWIERRENVSK